MENARMTISCSFIPCESVPSRCTQTKHLALLCFSVDSFETRCTRADARQMDAAERTFHNLGMKPTPESVEAEATRKAAVSFIIKRIQVDRDETPEEAGGAVVSHKVSMLQMAADEDGMHLLVDKPEGVNDTFNRAMTKRASM